MKNKEIEEVLDKLKDKDWYDELDLTGTKWIELKQEETNLLLTHIEQLENKYNKALEILSDYNMPCEYVKPIISDEYCEENCEVSDEVYKKCWNKHIELTLKGDSE